MAANRIGKSYCGSMELSYHLTGLYPDWWEGRVYRQPIVAWAGGVSNETTRDIVQYESYTTNETASKLDKENDWGNEEYKRHLVTHI